MSRRQRIDEIFDKALDQDDATRADFIRTACGDDLEMAATITRLVATVDDAGDFLENQSADARDAIADAAMAEKCSHSDNSLDRTGSMVGPYKLIREIGRGGRSTVFEAERSDDDWHQTVAVKILRRGVDTDDIVSRFLAERQILLLLNHPGISSIVDGGMTEDGLPFFAMDLIDGEPITDFCKSRKLSLNERLRLFVNVAEAVEYAHRHLVIHRDIEPSNILVNEDGISTLLDFGIAKIVDASQSDIVMAHTQTEMRIMTPVFASPEQRAGEPVTTAADIYQLGLLLTVILTDELPGDGETPSQLLSKTADTSYKAAALSPDIDTIVSKALRVEPSERYRSVTALIEDIELHLRNRPISAQPPSLRYRVAKFMKRQPWAAPVAAVSTVAIVAAIVMTSAYTLRLQEERDRAESIKTFLMDFLRAPDPFEGEGRELTVEQALGNAVSTADTSLAQRPELQTEVYAMLAGVYTNLDLHEEALDLRERLLVLKQSGPQTPEYEVLLARLNVSVSEIGAGKFADARDDIVAITDALRNQHSEQEAALAYALLEFGTGEKDYGDVVVALELIEESVTLYRAATTTNSVDLARALHTVASAYNMQGNTELALAAIDEAIEIRSAVFGPKSLRTLLSRIERATTLDEMHDYVAAGVEYEDLVDVLSEALGPSHSYTLTTLNNQARTMVAEKRRDEAELIYRDILERKRKKYDGEPAATVAITLQNIATLLSSQGRDDEAVPLLIEVREIFAKVLEPDNYRNAYPDLTLSRIYAGMGDYVAMEASAGRARNILENAVPTGHAAREMAYCRHGEALIRLGHRAQGKAAIESAIANLTPQEKLPALYLNECRAALDL